MKKMKIIFLAIIGIMAGTAFTGSAASLEIFQGGIEAKQDSMTDYQKFKKETEEKIRDNEKAIANHRAMIAKDTREVRDKHEKKLSKLEEKNKELKKKLADYKYDQKDESKWTSFKREFNHDMDELGKSLKDIGKDNVK